MRAENSRQFVNFDVLSEFVAIADPKIAMGTFERQIGVEVMKLLVVDGILATRRRVRTLLTVKHLAELRSGFDVAGSGGILRRDGE